MTGIPAIPAFDGESASRARERQSILTKPEGSLGSLEELSIRLAGMKGTEFPSVERKAVIIMAADHGVTVEGVSAYPAEVTRQMVLNFLNGGAAINVLSRMAGARVTVVDIGVSSEFGELPGLLGRKIAHGTANIARGPAMTREQAIQAVGTGIDVVLKEIDDGLDLVATGDMGIGNTTPSAAVAAVMTGLPARTLAGRGTGLDGEGLERKISVIERAIAANGPDASDPLDVLAKVGGLEIGGLAGVMIGAASRRVPVVVDGYISTAAALIASGLEPGIRDFLISAHLSAEGGHGAMLEKLGLAPLLKLGLRLGEGTGAVLAFNLLEASCRILSEMATFEEAGVRDIS